MPETRENDLHLLPGQDRHETSERLVGFGTPASEKVQKAVVQACFSGVHRSHILHNPFPWLWSSGLNELFFSA